MLWTSLQGDDKARLDGILKKVVTNFIPDEGLERQKQFFLTSNDILPMKIAALAMDPVVRSYISDRIKITPNSFEQGGDVDDLLPMVKCRHCGSVQILDDLRRSV